jgi:hypothetical protein
LGNLRAEAESAPPRRMRQPQKGLRNIDPALELLQVLAKEATNESKRFRSRASALAAIVEVLRHWHSGETDDASGRVGDVPYQPSDRRDRGVLLRTARRTVR